MKSRKRKSNQAGFTLVEIAMALLVVAVGLTVVIGLFPAGLQANKMAIDETQMAMVADEIFNGIKAISKQMDWAKLAAGNFTLPPPAKEFWETSPGLWVVPSPSGDHTPSTHVFTYKNESVAAYAYRYNLQVVPITGAAPKILGLKLQLWNGEQGPVDKGAVFYTEIYYNGK